MISKLLNFLRIKPNISYGITVCDEAKELNSLLSVLIPLVGKKDEIIVLWDVTRRDSDVSKVIENFRDKLTVFEAKLNGDFASFKNNFLKVAHGSYLFQIDADEIPQVSLINGIKDILLENRKCDCFRVPRINIVNGYTNEHVRKWKWEVGENNYINYPDYQPRIIKLTGKIKWQNRVHEEFVGYERMYELPSVNTDYCLIHIKDIERQEKQNDFYERLK